MISSIHGRARFHRLWRPPEDAVSRWIRRRPLALAALCWLIGIAAALYARVPWWAYGALAALMTAAAIALRRIAWLFGALMAAGALAAALTLAAPQVPVVSDARITGRVASEPIDRGEVVVFRLTDARVDGESCPDLMAYAYKNGAEIPALTYGVEVSLTGKTWLPQPVANPSGFDAALYYARLRVGGGLTASARSLRVTDDARPTLIGWSLLMRGRLDAVVEALYPRQRALMAALLLGERVDVEESLMDAFQASGLLHMLSLSGLHLSLLAALMQGLLRMARLPLRAAYLITLAMLALYGLLVGFPVALVRALIMFALMSGGRAFGLPADPLTGLAAAFLALTVITPLNATDAGFILSFSAMAGMILLMPALGLPLSAQAGRSDRSRTARLRRAVAYAPDAMGVSLCAQLGSLPAVTVLYHALPVYGLFANALASPLIAVALPAGMASLLLGTIWLPLGKGIAFLAESVLNWVEGVARWVSALPHAQLAVPGWPTWLIVAYAATLFLCSPFARVPRRIRPWLLSLLPLAVAVTWLLVPSRVDGRLEISFLSVGQADAAVVRSGRAVALVDVGKGSDAAEYLAGTGLRAGAIFLTHPHEDHIGGLDEVVALNPPGTLYLPWCWDEMEADASVAGAVDAARSAGWKVIYLHKGDRVPLGGDAYAEVVHPADDFPTDDANAASMVLALRYGDGAALLMADLTSKDEVDAFPDCDVIKVAHHGSNESTGERVLQLSTPSVAVISVGPNSYGHPGAEAVARLQAAGAKIYRTDRRGMVTVSIDQSGKAEVRCFRDDEEAP